jgi:uncharacterized membrane protein YhhN
MIRLPATYLVLGFAACVIGGAVMIVGERTRRPALRFVGKPLASAGFLVVAACAHPSGAFASCVVVGLVLGAIGDIALLWERGFVIGLALFLLGHLAYVVAVAQVAPPSAWITPYAILPLVAGAVALAWVWPHLGPLRGAVIAYVAAISAMVIAAIALGNPRFLAGAVLFFASDLAVAREKFVARSFANHAWGVPAYYAGQLLIAWSL